MFDTITLTGIVATEPRQVVTTEGLAITTFRLASGQRRFDRPTNSWVDAETNWYTVSAFRLLAGNVARSVQKGQHIMVTGKLRLREWTSGERSGTSVEVAAESLGHDLNWYVTTAIRTSLTAQAPPNPGQAPRASVTDGSDEGAGARAHGGENDCTETIGAEGNGAEGSGAETSGSEDVNVAAEPEAPHPAMLQPCSP